MAGIVGGFAQSVRSSLDNDLSDEPGNGYPAFVDFRQGRGDVSTRGDLARLLQVGSEFSLERYRTDYRLGTPAFDEPWGGPRHAGVRHLSGVHQSDVLSFSYTSRPMPRLFATTSVGYTDTWSGTIESEAIGLRPFEGDVWFYVDHLNYVFNPATDLTFTRSYYRANYGDSNLPGAIAYGLDAERYGILLAYATGWERRRCSTSSTAGSTMTNQARTGRTITRPTCSSLR